MCLLYVVVKLFLQLLAVIASLYLDICWPSLDRSSVEYILLVFGDSHHHTACETRLFRREARFVKHFFQVI